MTGMAPVSPVRRILNERDRGFAAAVVVPLGSRSMIFISGEIGRDASGRIAGGGFEAETRQCFANLDSALRRAAAGFKDVVRITAYVKDLADYPVYARIRGEIFGAESEWPASATVGVSDLLLGARIEIDAVAVIDSDATVTT